MVRSKKVFLPDKEYNVTWEILDIKSLNLIYELIHKIEKYDSFTYHTEKHELETILESKSNYCVGGYDPNQNLAAYGIVKFRPEEKIVYCVGGVDPLYRTKGIGTALLKWYKKIGTKILKDKLGSKTKFNLLSNKTKKFGHVIIEINDDRKELQLTLQKIDFKSQNKFCELRKKILEVDKNITLPPFTKITDWDETLENMVKKTNDELLAKYDLSDAQLQWQKYMEYANKDWCKILLDKSTDRTKVIGYIISSKYEQDWKILGHKESYIDFITVIPKDEQRMLVEAIIQSHINTCIKDELDCVAIGIEPDKQPELYEILMNMGFEISHSSTEYISKPILL